MWLFLLLPPHIEWKLKKENVKLNKKQKTDELRAKLWTSTMNHFLFFIDGRAFVNCIVCSIQLNARSSFEQRYVFSFCTIFMYTLFDPRHCFERDGNYLSFWILHIVCPVTLKHARCWPFGSQKVSVVNIMPCHCSKIRISFQGTDFSYHFGFPLFVECRIYRVADPPKSEDPMEIRIEDNLLTRNSLLRFGVALRANHLPPMVASTIRWRSCTNWKSEHY